MQKIKNLFEYNGRLKRDVSKLNVYLFARRNRQFCSKMSIYVRHGRKCELRIADFAQVYFDLMPI